MDLSPYAILGLEEDAAIADVEACFSRLTDLLEKLRETSAHEQAQRALNKIVDAYGQIKNAHLRKVPVVSSDQNASVAFNNMHPRLGQICVASGMLTMEQLNEAVEDQLRTGLPLGEVLQDKQFLSPIQLEGLLLGQEMIDLPSKCTDPDGRRLIALDIVSEDMVLIVQMEQKSVNQSLTSLLLRRGWVDQKMFEALGMVH